MLNAVNIEPDDREAFTANARIALDSLHKGVITRYGLRPG